jgi:azurin
MGQQIGTQTSYGKNLLANASFEQMENNAPASWHSSRQRGAPRITVANVARSGEHSLEIRANEQADAAWSQEVLVKPHTAYRLSGWIKTEGVDKGSGLGALLTVREFGQPDPDLAVAGTADWVAFEQVFDTGTHDRLFISASFGHAGLSTGTVWFDDLELAEVPSALLRLVKLDEVKKLIALQNSAASVASHNGSDANLRVIELSVREGLMAYTQQTLTVSAGERVKLVFKNTDHMPHNAVFTAIGAKDKVGQLADEMAASPTGAAQQYVPQVSEVLFATPLVDPGESFELAITAPSKPGDYPYICTFPGHWRLMQGVLQVQERK